MLSGLLVEDASYSADEVRDFTVGPRVLRLEGGLLLGELDLCLDTVSRVLASMASRRRVDGVERDCPRETHGLSCDHDDGATAACSHEDAIAATARSDTPRRPRRGPNRLKFGPETTHFHHSWRRRASMA